MSAKETLIKVENLQKYYKGGAIKALDGINTEIKKGEVVVVIGPSGSGKSTFLRCLNLLEKKQTSISTGRKWGWCSSILTFSLT